MFGLGKKSSKGGDASPPEAKATKASRSSEGGFNFVDFLLQHGEKFVVLLVVLTAGYFLYSGFTTPTIEPNRTTDDLITKASSTRKSIVEDDHWDQIASTRTKEVDFRKQTERSRLQTEASPYRTELWEGGPRNAGGRRGDPMVIAPTNLQAEAFMGAIASKSKVPAMIDKLPAALPLGEKRRATRRGEEETPTSERRIPDGYDFAYKPTATELVTDKTGLVKSDAETVVPEYTTFAVVTAAVPHQEMVDNYLKEFESAPDYNPNRDSPNYLGFEVQRVDVTKITDLSTITDADWQNLPDVAPEMYAKRIEKWPGTADETAKETYVSEKLTLKIPPILISRYDRLVDNPKIPQIVKKAAAASGGGGGYGGGSNYGAGYGQSSESSYGAGYGGGSSYGAGYGTQSSSNYGGSKTAEVEDTTEMSKAETLSDHKLLRFFDFNVQPGHVYIYRVRVVLEDPNYPRAKSLQPKTSTMKPETVARVQELQMQDEKRLSADKKAKRSSRLETEWSAASPSVTIPSRSRLYASSVKKSSDSVETSIVYGEWDQKLGAFVPVHQSERFKLGTVFGGLMDKVTLDVIDPISKVVRDATGYKFGNALTITDISGGDKLADAPPKNELLSEGQVVAFDSASGELVISREFDDYVQFRLYSFADDREKADEKKSEAAGTAPPKP